MKKLIAVLFSALAASAFAGDTYYADASVEVSGDGLTPETAKKTIQEAVDLCATSGDTVKVAEGVYQDTNTCTYVSARAVVIITNKIHLVATGAKERTIIKGAFDSTSGNVGPDAVRGVYVYYTGNDTKGKRTANSIIEGFTVCNGATSASGSGGGMSIQSSYAVNCIVSNCVAKQCGAFFRGTVIRCLVTDCRATGTTATDASLGFSTTFLNSIITRMPGTERLTAYTASICNCTIVGNASSTFTGYSDGTFKLYNSIVLDNAFTQFYASAKPTASNCVFQTGMKNWNADVCGNIRETAEKYFFAAPAFGDWRPTAASGAAEWGDADLLKVISLPTTLEEQRYLDFYGKPIPQTGKITCGAVQEVAASRQTLLSLVADGAAWEFGNTDFVCRTMPKDVREQNYFWFDGNPGMFKLRKVGATLTGLFGYSLSTNGIAYVEQIDPNLDNWAGIVTCPGATNKVSVVASTHVYYVDAAAVTDEGATGAADKPYATIQAAVNAAPNNSARRTVILVRKGEYRPDPSSGYTVRVYNKTPGTSGDWWYKRLRIVAEDGPEKTFIFGARGEDADGCGSGAIACCYVEVPSMIQGFTLTGGYGDRGVAAGGNSAANARYLDCVITNNCGKSSIVYTAIIVRCRIADNVVTTGSSSQPFYGDITGSTADNRVKAYACEIVHSASSVANSHAVARFADIAFCSIVGTCAGNTYFGSILPGGAGKVLGSANMCFAQGEPFTGSATDCKNGKSRCLSYAKGDFRLRDDSPCLGMVTVDPVADRNYLTLDMDGNPLKLDSLVGNTAGAHQMWSVHYEPQGLLMLVR